MNVPAMVSCAVAGGPAASADGVRQGVVEASRSVLGFLFPLLLGELLRPEAGQSPPLEKKQKESFPGASVAAGVPVPVPLPAPPGFVLAPISGQAGSAACAAPDRRSPELEPTVAPFGLSAATEEETAAAGMADLGQIAPRARAALASGSNQAAAAQPDLESAGASWEMPTPANFVLETIAAGLTVPPPPSSEAVPAPPANPKAPTPEIAEPSRPGVAQSEPVPLASSKAAPAGAPPRTPPVPDLAATGWIATAPSEIEALAPERASRAVAAESPEPAGSKLGPAGAVPPTPASFEGANLQIQPARKTDLAFSARLAPLDQPLSPHPGVAVQEKSTAPRQEGSVPSLPPVEMDASPVRREAPAAGSMMASRTAAHASANPAPDQDVAVRNAGPPARADVARVVDVPVAASSERPAPASPVAEPQRAAVTAPPEPAPRWSAPAREIRLQVTGGEERVDVRLTEHRGEVQVAVRTPDSRLTEALRNDLPALSARLEQNGFRAETWHPAASRLEHFALTPEPSSSGSAPQGHGGERHRNPQDQEPPPRRAPLAEDRPDSPPPEFFMTNLIASLRRRQ